MNNNVVFFLKFKQDLQFLYDTLSIREALILMKKHGFTAVPVISKEGEYCGSVNEGDFLWYLISHGAGEDVLDDTAVRQLIRPGFMPAVNINVSIDHLLEMALHQNYIPVVDDRSCFIGIVTRQALLRHYCSQSCEDTNENSSEH